MRKMSKALARRGSLSLLLCAALVAGSSAPALAQDVAARFPKPDDVKAAYPGDAESFAALTVLYLTVQTTSAMQSMAARDRGSEYADSSARIQSKYLKAAANTKAAADFNERANLLFNDTKFRQSVLERYHLADLPPAKPAVQTVSPQSAEAAARDEIRRVVRDIGVPSALVTVLLMFIVAGLLERRTTKSPSLDMPRTARSGGLPPLPESLREIRVPGLRYSVDTLSGLVLDKETTVETHVQSTPVPAQGNMPGYMSTSVSTTRKDIVWVRTPDNQENAWTFVETELKIRPGNLVSVVARRPLGGDLGFLAGYNHTTGQWVQIGDSRHTPRIRNAWLAATLVGAIGFKVAFTIFSIDPDSVWGFRSPAIMLFFMSAVVAAIVALVIAVYLQHSISRRRNSAFTGRYAPAFREYFEQCTPVLQKVYGTAAAPTAPLTRG